MKLFGRTFFESKKQDISFEIVDINQSNHIINETNSDAGFQAFGSIEDLFNPENPNLAAPFVDERMTQNGMVYFGQDNLEAKRLARLYCTSGLHASICNYKMMSISGKGYLFDNLPEESNKRIDVYTFEKRNKISKFVKDITQDYVIHGGMYAKICFDASGKPTSVKRMDPTQIFCGPNDDDGNIDMFYFNYDFEFGYKTVPIPAYKPNRRAPEMIVYWHAPHPYLKVYTLPSYAAAANAVYVDGEIPYMYKSYLINSINPAFYLSFPRRINPEGQKALKKILQGGKGVPQNGKALVFQSESKESMPTIGTIATSGNDKMFTNSNSQIQDRICYAHTINPGIIGLKVNSSLGNSEELDRAIKDFRNIFVLPARESMREFINDILFIFNIPTTLSFKETEEAAIIAGVEAEKKTEMDAETTKETQTNEVLRALTGREHQQLLRIIRQFTSGKLTAEAAALMLKSSLGVSDEDANILLGITE